MQRINCQQMASKLGAYLVESVMPTMKNPGTIGMLSVAGTTLGRKAIENKIGHVFSSVADEDGTVDVSELRESVTAYAKHAGGIPILFDRVTLQMSDVNAFFDSL